MASAVSAPLDRSCLPFSYPSCSTSIALDNIILPSSLGANDSVSSNLAISERNTTDSTLNGILHLSQATMSINQDSYSFKQIHDVNSDSNSFLASTVPEPPMTYVSASETPASPSFISLLNPQISSLSPLTSNTIVSSVPPFTPTFTNRFDAHSMSVEERDSSTSSTSVASPVSRMNPVISSSFSSVEDTFVLSSSSSRRKSAWPISSSIVERMPGIIFTLDEPTCPHLPQFHFPYDPEDSDDDFDYVCTLCNSSSSSEMSYDSNNLESFPHLFRSSSLTTNGDSDDISLLSSSDIASFPDTLSSPSLSCSFSPSFSSSASSTSFLSLSQDTFHSLKEETESGYIDIFDPALPSSSSSSASLTSSFSPGLFTSHPSSSSSICSPSNTNLNEHPLPLNSNPISTPETPSILTPPLTPMQLYLRDPIAHHGHLPSSLHSSFSTSPKKVVHDPVPNLASFNSSPAPTLPIHQITSNSLLPKSVPAHELSSTNNHLSSLKKASSLSNDVRTKLKKTRTTSIPSRSSISKRRTKLKFEDLLLSSSSSLTSLPHRNDRVSSSSNHHHSSKASKKTKDPPSSLAYNFKLQTVVRIEDPLISSSLTSSIPTPSLSISSSSSLSTLSNYSDTTSSSSTSLLYPHLCYSCQNDFLTDTPSATPLPSFSSRPTRSQRLHRHTKPELCPVCSDLFQRHGLRCTACYFVPAENVVESGQVKCERCFGGTYTCDRL